MAFSNQDRINLVTKSLVAGVLDANSLSQWYETIFPFTFMIHAGKLLTELDKIRQYPANSLQQAQSNVASHLQGVVDDFSSLVNAIRLTEIPDTNGTTWASYEVYGDRTSLHLDNWLQPQLVPQPSGNPSNGYGILLFDGDPNNGGELISTSAYMTGAGNTRSVSWFWNYSNGLLLLSQAFVAARPNFDPYVTGFRYVGGTVNSATEEVEALTAEIEVLKASFDTFKLEVETQILALELLIQNIDVTTLGEGVSLGSRGADGSIELKSLTAGDFVTLSDVDGEVKISVESATRTGMISRFVKGG